MELKQRLSVPLLAILALYLIPFGTQVYGSTENNNQCDLPANQSCLQTSSTPQIKSEIESETTQTPLILPDLSPTREDLKNNVEADESTKAMDSNDNEGGTTSTSTDSDDSGTTENNAADNSDDEQESDEQTNGENSEDDDGKDSGDGPSTIPFP